MTALEVTGPSDGAPESQAEQPPPPRLHTLAAELTGPAATGVAVAVTVAVISRDEGAYYVDVWAPLGLVLLATFGALVFLRRGPARLPSIGAAALLALGAWALLSTLWGGLGNEAWTMLDQSIIAAAALLCGSALAADARWRVAITAGVFLGLVAHVVEILVRVGISGGPASWYYLRFLEGPVGYHNAQATVFVLGLVLSLGAVASAKVYVRAVGGAAAGLFPGALVLTQSRGGLLAAGIAGVAFLAWARSLRVLLFSLPLLVVVAAQVIALRPVDAALATGTAAAHVDELRRYVLWAVLAAVALAAAAAVSAPSRSGRLAAATVAGLAVIVCVAGAVQARSSIRHAVHRVATGIGIDSAPDTAAPGETRLASLSLNGRRQAWRIAWNMTKDRPLAGAGQGQFSRRWGRDRPASATYTYVLQPHSIELELSSELGIVGLGMFAVFLGAAALAVRKATSRLHTALAGSLLVAVLAESSVDWTWSFPAVVVPVLLVVGASTTATRVGRLRLWSPTAVPVVVVGVVLLAGPYLSDRQLDRGRALARKNPDRAWSLALDAHSLNPWDARVPAFEGRLAETSGRYVLAADKYDAAAALARQPWVDYFRAARALQEGGNTTRLRRACKQAQQANPKEPLLRLGPCAPPTS